MERLTLSTKRLEREPGDMLRNPAAVYAQAEETARIFRCGLLRGSCSATRLAAVLGMLLLVSRLTEDRHLLRAQLLLLMLAWAGAYHRCRPGHERLLSHRLHSPLAAGCRRQRISEAKASSGSQDDE